MVHGQPDFGLYTSKKTTYGLADLGELAARLGSIATYDRRGDIVFIDGFDSDLSAYTVTGDGDDWSVTQSAISSRNGGYAAQMVCGSDDDRRAEMIKYLPYPALAGWGVEFSFNLQTWHEWLLLYMVISEGAGGKLWEAALSYNQDTSLLEYMDDTGGYSTLQEDLDLYCHLTLFHTIKVVIDFENGKYVRALLDDRSWDMSTYTLHSANVLAGAPYSKVNIEAQGEAGKNATLYVDGLIITQNEP